LHADFRPLRLLFEKDEELVKKLFCEAGLELPEEVPVKLTKAQADLYEKACALKGDSTPFALRNVEPYEEPDLARLVELNFFYVTPGQQNAKVYHAVPGKKYELEEPQDDQTGHESSLAKAAEPPAEETETAAVQASMQPSSLEDAEDGEEIVGHFLHEGVTTPVSARQFSTMLAEGLLTRYTNHNGHNFGCTVVSEDPLGLGIKHVHQGVIRLI
jgi:hypothetical protein